MKMAFLHNGFFYTNVQETVLLGQVIIISGNPCLCLFLGILCVKKGLILRLDFFLALQTKLGITDRKKIVPNFLNMQIMWHSHKKAGESTKLMQIPCNISSWFIVFVFFVEINFVCHLTEMLWQGMGKMQNLCNL